MDTTPNDFVGIGLMMLSLSAPVTAAIVRFHWRNKSLSQAPAVPPNSNGSKVDIREFMDFREEVREGFRDVKGEMATLRVLIQERL